MPRKSEIVAEEAAVASPLRRSNRTTAGSAGTNPIQTRRASLLSQENEEEKVESKTTTRSRRATSVTKEESKPKPEPAQTRARRASANIEVPPVEEQRQEEARKPVRTRRSSVAEEKIEDPPVAKTPQRRRSVTETDVPKGKTRGRRPSVEKTEIVEEPPKRVTRTTRRSSIDTNTEEEPEKKISKPNTPTKPRRRLSITENVVPMEAITEQETEKIKRNSKSPVPEISIKLTPVKQTQVKKTDLDLSIINETSFVEEIEDSPKKAKSPITSKQSPVKIIDSLSIKLTPMKKNDLPKIATELSSIGEENPEKLTPKLQSSLAPEDERLGLRKVSPKVDRQAITPQKLSFEEIEEAAKLKQEPQTSSRDDDSVFVDTPTSFTGVRKTPLISSGSDGSFTLHLDKSLMHTTSQESQDDDVNTSTQSNGSDKENIAAEQNISDSGSIKEIKIIAALTDTANLSPRVEKYTVARVSNVFRPKNTRFSFIEPMEVDKTIIDTNVNAAEIENENVELEKESSQSKNLEVDDNSKTLEKISEGKEHINNDKSDEDHAKAVDCVETGDLSQDFEFNVPSDEENDEDRIEKTRDRSTDVSVAPGKDKEKESEKMIEENRKVTDAAPDKEKSTDATIKGKEIQIETPKIRDATEKGKEEVKENPIDVVKNPAVSVAKDKGEETVETRSKVSDNSSDKEQLKSGINTEVLVATEKEIVKESSKETNEATARVINEKATDVAEDDTVTVTTDKGEETKKEEVEEKSKVHDEEIGAEENEIIEECPKVTDEAPGEEIKEKAIDVDKNAAVSVETDKGEETKAEIIAEKRPKVSYETSDKEKSKSLTINAEVPVATEKEIVEKSPQITNEVSDKEKAIDVIKDVAVSVATNSETEKTVEERAKVVAETSDKEKSKSLAMNAEVSVATENEIVEESPQITDEVPDKEKTIDVLKDVAVSVTTNSETEETVEERAKVVAETSDKEKSKSLAMNAEVSVATENEIVEESPQITDVVSDKEKTIDVLKDVAVSVTTNSETIEEKAKVIAEPSNEEKSKKKETDESPKVIDEAADKEIKEKAIDVVQDATDKDKVTEKEETIQERTNVITEASDKEKSVSLAVDAEVFVATEKEDIVEKSPKVTDEILDTEIKEIPKNVNIEENQDIEHNQHMCVADSSENPATPSKSVSESKEKIIQKSPISEKDNSTVLVSGAIKNLEDLPDSTTKDSDAADTNTDSSTNLVATASQNVVDKITIEETTTRQENIEEKINDDEEQIRNEDDGNSSIDDLINEIPVEDETNEVQETVDLCKNQSAHESVQVIEIDDKIENIEKNNLESETTDDSMEKNNSNDEELVEIKSTDVSVEFVGEEELQIDEIKKKKLKHKKEKKISINDDNNKTEVTTTKKKMKRKNEDSIVNVEDSNNDSDQPSSNKQPKLHKANSNEKSTGKKLKSIKSKRNLLEISTDEISEEYVEPENDQETEPEKIKSKKVSIKSRTKIPITRNSDSNDEPVIGQQEEEKASNTDSNEELADEQANDGEIKQKTSKLDEYLEKQLENIENEEDDDVFEEGSENDNSFIDDMAEEGEEDTPSDDSNDIIDEGESINTTESEWSEGDYDDSDSFICDEEATELLPGDEYDLEESTEKPRKSRIINVDNRDEDVIQIKRKIKTPQPRKPRTRIISPESSTDNEEDADDKVSSEDSQQSPKESVEAEEDDGGKESSQDNGLSFTEDQPVSTSSVRRSSITIHENIKVSEIEDPALSSRINHLINSFSKNISKGDVSVSLSMEYEGNDADGPNSDNVDIKTARKKRLSETMKSAEKNKRSLKTKNDSGSPNKKMRLSVSLDNIHSPSSNDDAKASTSRRLSASMDDSQHKKLRRKKKKMQAKSKTDLLKGVQDKSPRKSLSAEDLRAETFSLMSQLLTDVKNRPRRTIKPTSNIDLNTSWIVDDVTEVKPSTSLVSHKDVEQFKAAKIKAKDFKSQMLNDPSRIRRIQTKSLLKTKSA